METEMQKIEKIIQEFFLVASNLFFQFGKRKFILKFDQRRIKRKEKNKLNYNNNIISVMKEIL